MSGLGLQLKPLNYVASNCMRFDDWIAKALTQQTQTSRKLVVGMVSYWKVI